MTDSRVRRMATSTATAAIVAAALVAGAQPGIATTEATEYTEYEVSIGVRNPTADSVAAAPLDTGIGQPMPAPAHEIAVTAADLEEPGGVGTMAFDIPRATLEDCYFNPGARTVVSRFSECNDTTIYAQIFARNSDGQIVLLGTADFNLSNITDTYHGTKGFVRQGELWNIVTTGVATQSIQLLVSYKARPTWTPWLGQCDATTQYIRTVPEWRINPTMNATAQVTDSASRGTDKIQHCEYYTTVQARYAPSAGIAGVISNTIEVLPGHAICDSATYVYDGSVQYPTGCRLNVRPTFEISRSDPLVNESADHIHDALNAPNLNIPSVLTRVYHDTSLRNANRSTALAYCRLNYGYPTGNDHCDEYPFASTYEGAASPVYDFSARYITSDDNIRVGSYLSRFFSENRVIDSQELAGHEFEVSITP